MVKGFTSTSWTIFFHRAEDKKTTRGHSWKLLKIHCRCKTRLQFFSQRVINRWNSLSEEDISVSSVNSTVSRKEEIVGWTSLKTRSLQVLLAARVRKSDGFWMKWRRTLPGAAAPRELPGELHDPVAVPTHAGYINNCLRPA